MTNDSFDRTFLLRAPSGTVYPYLNQAKKYLLAGSGADVLAYRTGTKDAAKPVIFSWKTPAVLRKITLQYSDHPDFHKAVCLSADGCRKSFRLLNLYKAREYFWRLTAEEENGTVLERRGQFHTTDLGPRVMSVNRIYNVRDVGGYTTDSGLKTRQGLLFRGGGLWKDSEFPHLLTRRGKMYMSNELGIRTELDVRGADTLTDPPTESMIPGAVLLYAKINGYQGIYEDQEGFQQIFRILAQKENYPVYVHCTGGADRTATAIFVLQALLGVSRQDIIWDYEFTSFSIYGDRRFEQYLSIAENYLNSLKGNTLRERAEVYLQGIGITDEEIGRIREIMLEK